MLSNGYVKSTMQLIARYSISIGGEKNGSAKPRVKLLVWFRNVDEAANDDGGQGCEILKKMWDVLQKLQSLGVRAVKIKYTVC